jgi:RNA polymerase sigma factor (sigma-70 family)
MTSRDDNYFIEQVLKGDSSAYAMLVEKHKDMVFNIAVRILRSREEAEDLSQEVFLKAYQSLKEFEGKARFSTWLYRIAYNAAISRIRKAKPEFSAIDEALIDNHTTDVVSNGVDALSREEQIRAVEMVMNALPAEDNLLLTLFYKNEHSVEEISEITGYTQSNVKVKLYRIRKRMYDDLKNQLEL